MSSVPEGRPIVRGEHVYLRAPERDDIPLFVRWFNDAGYGTHALRAICDFGFGDLRLERIGLLVYEGNDRTRRSYEKAGFTHEGTMRRAYFAHGEHHDVHVMGLLLDEWAAQSRRRSWEYD